MAGFFSFRLFCFIHFLEEKFILHACSEMEYFTVFFYGQTFSFDLFITSTDTLFILEIDLAVFILKQLEGTCYTFRVINWRKNRKNAESADPERHGK